MRRSRRRRGDVTTDGSGASGIREAVRISSELSAAVERRVEERGSRPCRSTRGGRCGPTGPSGATEYFGEPPAGRKEGTFLPTDGGSARRASPDPDAVFGLEIQLVAGHDPKCVVPG